MSIKVNNVSYVYQVGTPYEKMALRDVSLTINDNSVVGLFGITSSGKTTLLQVMAGLIVPQKGQVLVDDVKLTPKGKRPRFTNIGLVFQFPETQFVLDKVYDEIAYGLTYQNLDKLLIKERVEKSLDLVGLPFPTYKDRSIRTLSSGEKRRVAIATILALDSKYILLDEPTAGLDYSGRLGLERLIADLKANDKTVVLVSHNLNYLLNICDEIYIMADGIIDSIITNKSSLMDLEALYISNYILPAYLETVFKLRARGYDISLNNKEDVLEGIAKVFRGDNYA